MWRDNGPDAGQMEHRAQEARRTVYLNCARQNNEQTAAVTGRSVGELPVIACRTRAIHG